MIKYSHDDVKPKLQRGSQCSHNSCEVLEVFHSFCTSASILEVCMKLRVCCTLVVRGIQAHHTESLRHTHRCPVIVPVV